jgi:hypothetical protein
VRRFVLSLSTLIFKAFAVKDEFWATTFWMFAARRCSAWARSASAATAGSFSSFSRRTAAR